MPFVSAGGVQVNFPFEPYSCQLDYMQKVITCLQQGYNGILESPTGTGKTLCLLCASLAWLEGKKAQIQNQKQHLQDADLNSTQVENIYKDDLSRQLDLAAGTWAGELSTPKIIYASRTHSQLGQAMQELKRSAYCHFKASVIGSREQLCVHPQVMKESNTTVKVHLCRAKVSARSCHFYNQVENGKAHFSNKVLDIEDLVTLGQKLNCCPYYVARELKKDADIIFMPYNYLLDPKLRKAHGVELQGNIVIFDEAHNLEQICEDSSSFDLSSGDVASAIKELNCLAEEIQEWQQTDFGSTDLESRAVQDFTLVEILQIKAQLLHLEKEIDEIEIKGSDGVTKDGSFIFEIFDKINLTFENKNLVYNALEKMIAYLSNDTSGSAFSSRGYGLSKILDVVKIVFSTEPSDFTPIGNHKKAVSKHYKVHIRMNTVVKKKRVDGWGSTSEKPSSGRIFSYWCFSPGYTMQDLKSSGVKSIILTSGTLSPLSSFSSEMGINFQIQLENPHVIAKEQVWIGSIGKGPDGVRLSSAYDTRYKDNYQISLGNAVVNFARTIPNGLLLFFPSYPVMEKCLEKWQEIGIRARIEQHKALFTEPKSKFEFSTAMDNFYEKVNDPSCGGAIFAAVCRGKVSEGLDFSDSNGRAVVVTGLPFPPRMDPKVILKMKFLDGVRVQAGNGSKSLSGDDWYKQQASRAVNQAIGRVIRHRNDYGAILLCDARFCNNYANQLPLWLRPIVQNYENFGQAMRDMMAFFKSAEKSLPPPNPSRKRKKPGDVLGCQGAYFAPESSSGPRKRALAQLDKASVVMTHVPSIRPPVHDDLSMERLKQSYSGSSSKAAEKPRGLLRALDENEKAIENFAVLDLEPVQTVTLKSDTIDGQKPRKRIALKMESSKVITKCNLETAEAYLKEVKRVLSEQSYSRFSLMLKEYRENGEFDAMFRCVEELFAQDFHNHHLLRKFCRFVKRDDREKFERQCDRRLGPDPKISRKGKSSGGEKKHAHPAVNTS